MLPEPWANSLASPAYWSQGRTATIRSVLAGGLLRTGTGCVAGAVSTFGVEVGGTGVGCGIAVKVLVGEGTNVSVIVGVRVADAVEETV